MMRASIAISKQICSNENELKNCLRSLFSGSNNERPFFERDGASEGGSFSRGERIRGISGSSDGRNRGPRQNWKDNDEPPFKNRNNRSFDNHRDMRKSSRWGNNSPKSIASEENWNSENPTSPPKKSTPRNKSDIPDSNKSTNSAPTGDAQANDSHAANDFEGDQPSKVSNDDDTTANISKNTKQSPSRKSSATSTKARSSESNQTGNNNNQSTVDSNTTPLYDEPADVASSYSAKEKSQNAAASEKVSTPFSNENETIPCNNNNNQSSNTQLTNDEHVAEIETNNNN